MPLQLAQGLSVPAMTDKHLQVAVLCVMLRLWHVVRTEVDLRRWMGTGIGMPHVGLAFMAMPADLHHRIETPLTPFVAAAPASSDCRFGCCAVSRCTDVLPPILCTCNQERLVCFLPDTSMHHHPVCCSAVFSGGRACRVQLHQQRCPEECWRSVKPSGVDGPIPVFVSWPTADPGADPRPQIMPHPL